MGGMPFCTIPHFRAILTAESAASAPDVIAATLSYPSFWHSLLASNGHVALRMAMFAWVT